MGLFVRRHRGAGFSDPPDLDPTPGPYKALISFLFLCFIDSPVTFKFQHRYSVIEYRHMNSDFIC